MPSNRIDKVAIVGRSLQEFYTDFPGITEALVAGGKHTVTAITREGSQSELPSGVEVARVDYDKQESLVAALQGQDALIVTLNSQADLEGIQKKLIQAAGDAGVAWILPNEFGFDTANEQLIKDVVFTKMMVNTRANILAHGKSSFISVVTGFWYEWSLAIPPAYGIDLNNHSATLFDEGTTKISTSTWPQVGRAVAALLSLPIKSEGEGASCLEDFKNQLVYVSSFSVSQQDMLESAYRVTGTTEADWKIKKEGARKRYDEGIDQMKKGDRIGFVKMMYTRVFWDDNVGDHEGRVINKELGLPKEDLDEATKRAVQRAKEQKNLWVDGSD